MLGKDMKMLEKLVGRSIGGVNKIDFREALARVSIDMTV